MVAIFRYWANWADAKAYSFDFCLRHLFLNPRQQFIVGEYDFLQNHAVCDCYF